MIQDIIKQANELSARISKILNDGDWNESDHPRDNDGKFGPGGSGGGSGGGGKKGAGGGTRKVDHHKEQEKRYNKKFVEHHDKAKKALTDGGYKDGKWANPEHKEKYKHHTDRANKNARLADKHRRAHEKLEKQAGTYKKP